MDRAQLEVAAEQSETVDSRVGCDPDEPVYGELVSLIRYPLKVNWAGDRIHSLHDLSWDPDERSDKRAHAGEQGQAIESELMRFIEARILDRDLSEDAGLSEEAARALKALGYIE